MFFLQVEDSFDSAHFLKGYEGKYTRASLEDFN